VGDNKDRFVKVKMQGGGEIEIDITKSDYADKIKDFIMKSQENEEGLKTQALATQGKKMKNTTRRTGRGGSGSGNNQNSSGVGAGYNP
jgi:uncharacterized protein YeeX (DUF496 family)